MGINLGGFLAPLIAGTAGMKYNFHLGFGIAAVGMFLGLMVFMFTKKNKSWSRRYIDSKPFITSRKEKKVFHSFFGLAAVIVAILIIIAILTDALTVKTFIALVGVLGIAIPIAYFVTMYRSPKNNK
ncbi:hypothetical protein GCM10020331_051630 [Ectobacillus funiculus]